MSGYIRPKQDVAARLNGLLKLHCIYNSVGAPIMMEVT